MGRVHVSTDWRARRDNLVMWILIPVGLTVAGLAGTIVYRKKVLKKGVLTPERRQVFSGAMAKIMEPEKLRELAARFESEGLKKQAEILRKRAKLRSLPDRKSVV